MPPVKRRSKNQTTILIISKPNDRAQCNVEWDFQVQLPPVISLSSIILHLSSDSEAGEGSLVRATAPRSRNPGARRNAFGTFLASLEGQILGPNLACGSMGACPW